MRILHAPLNVANDGFALVQGLRSLGHQADIATIDQNKYVENGTIDLSFSRKTSAQRQLAKIHFVKEEMPKYDVVHFHAGRSILDYGEGKFSLLDLKQSSKRGQVVAATFHGCEVRDLQEGGCPWPCANPVCRQGEKRARLEAFFKYADLLYVATPDLLPAVPGARLLPQTVLHIEEQEVFTPQAHLPIKIVHAPSARSTKGTDDIEAVIKELQRSGLAIDFRVVNNVSHQQALEAMSEADIVIDHIQIGWYGVVSVEAASMGKPVIVRIDDSLVKVSGLPKPPFVTATKENLAEKIRLLYNEREALPALGQANRKFVLGRHGAQANAQRVARDYEKILEAKLRNKDKN